MPTLNITEWHQGPNFIPANKCAIQKMGTFYRGICKAVAWWQRICFPWTGSCLPLQFDRSKR